MDRSALQQLTKLSVKQHPELRSLLSLQALALLDDPESNSVDIFEPIYRDAASRMIKREMNDLRGAVRRSLAKGQDDEFERWCDEFYGNEHLAFAQRLFQPVLEAQKRSGKHVEEALWAYLKNYMTLRRADIAGEPADQLERDIEIWLIQAPGQLANEIIQAIAE